MRLKKFTCINLIYVINVKNRLGSGVHSNYAKNSCPEKLEGVIKVNSFSGN